MLYLAQVHKKTQLIGGSKAQLFLLVYQQGENSWKPVLSQEVILSKEANNFKDGVLVFVELTANRQVRKIQEAARPLVNILQNFSRKHKIFKTQQEEIEQWRQSLTYHSQELNRREQDLSLGEMEMQVWQEQLQQLRQDMETERQEIERLRKELERERQELEMLKPKAYDAVLGGQKRPLSNKLIRQLWE